MMPSGEWDISREVQSARCIPQISNGKLFLFSTLNLRLSQRLLDSSNPGTVVGYNLKMILKLWGNKSTANWTVQYWKQILCFYAFSMAQFLSFLILWVSHSVLFSLPVFRSCFLCFLCQFVIITHWLIMFTCTVPCVISYCQILSVFIMWYQFACFALCF